MSLYNFEQVKEALLSSTKICQDNIDIILQYALEDYNEVKEYEKKTKPILKEYYNVVPKDLFKYMYCGDNRTKYFKLTFGDDVERPEHKKLCICGYSDLVINKYICPKDNVCVSKIIIVGSCCIKRFVPEEFQSRTCEKCHLPHKNRKNNFCNDCRKIKNNYEIYPVEVLFKNKENFKKEYKSYGVNFDYEIRKWTLKLSESDDVKRIIKEINNKYS